MSLPVDVLRQNAFSFLPVHSLTHLDTAQYVQSVSAHAVEGLAGFSHCTLLFEVENISFEKYRCLFETLSSLSTPFEIYVFTLLPNQTNKKLVD